MLNETQIHFSSDNVQNCYGLTENPIAIRTVIYTVNSYRRFFQHFYAFHRRWDPTDVDLLFDAAAFPAPSAVIVNVVMSIDLSLIHPWFIRTYFFLPS